MRLWWTWLPGMAMNACIWWSYPYALFMFVLPVLAVGLLCCLNIPLLRRSQERNGTPRDDWRVWMVAWTGFLAVTPLGLFFLREAVMAPSDGMVRGLVGMLAFWFLLLAAVTSRQMRRLRQWQWERHNGFRPGPGLPNQ